MNRYISKVQQHWNRTCMCIPEMSRLPLRYVPGRKILPYARALCARETTENMARCTGVEASALCCIYGRGFSTVRGGGVLVYREGRGLSASAGNITNPEFQVAAVSRYCRTHSL